MSTAIDSTAIDTALREAAESGQVAGVVAMAASADGTIYEGAFGRRSLAEDAKMTMDTVFWIASMTKAVTAAACMQLVEQGRLDLDAPAGKVLPVLGSPRVLEGFADDGTPLLRPARGTVTLRNLLTHTSGFAYDTWNADQLRYVRHTGIPRYVTFIDPEACLPLAFEPGSAWQYGVGIDWAGKMLEAVTGSTLDAYMREHIFDPLDMKDTGYLLTDRVRDRFAARHVRASDGTLSPVSFDPVQDPKQFNGGGGLFSTAADYMKFLRMLLNGGALDGVRVLRPETVAAMGQNHIGDIPAGRLDSHLPEMSNDVDLYPGQPVRWGLSFLINMQDVPGARRAGSLAWAGVFNTYYWIDPTSRIAGLLLTQVLPFGDHPVLSLLDRFERGVYALAS